MDINQIATDIVIDRIGRSANFVNDSLQKANNAINNQSDRLVKQVEFYGGLKNATKHAIGAVAEIAITVFVEVLFFLAPLLLALPIVAAKVCANLILNVLVTTTPLGSFSADLKDAFEIGNAGAYRQPPSLKTWISRE